VLPLSRLSLSLAQFEESGFEVYESRVAIEVEDKQTEAELEAERRQRVDSWQLTS